MKQGSLFDIISPNGSDATVGLVGVMPAIRARMAVVAKRFEPGRDFLTDAVIKVAQRENIPLTKGGGKTITPDQLDKWLQPAATSHEPSLSAILCFCIATKDASPMEPVLKALGLVAVSPQDAAYLEYGKVCKELERDSEDRRRKKERKKMLESLL